MTIEWKHMTQTERKLLDLVQIFENPDEYGRPEYSLDDLARDARAFLDASVARREAQERPDWKERPAELTEAMVEAANEVRGGAWQDLWEAMYRAAPARP